MNRIKVVAGVIIKNNKVLITRRAPKENFGGGWEFPGGKIEANETPEECLARELKEELNVNISVGKLCTEVYHIYNDISICLIAYYCLY
ncbi:MAG: (deoxy)nucleoside triphosphate pyrophosphohydrolase [Clostridiales bacterium]|jgi:8-oxo-dGTP diphosphatase|nr:(deoxy)nucleoside triphosphate pyrophosphohydrolase [Clostridiales bacterium]